MSTIDEAAKANAPVETIPEASAPPAPRRLSDRERIDVLLDEIIVMRQRGLQRETRIRSFTIIADTLRARLDEAEALIEAHHLAHELSWEPR